MFGVVMVGADPTRAKAVSLRKPGTPASEPTTKRNVGWMPKSDIHPSADLLDGVYSIYDGHNAQFRGSSPHRARRRIQ